jgi:hypothetical protein
MATAMAMGDCNNKGNGNGNGDGNGNEVGVGNGNGDGDGDGNGNGHGKGDHYKGRAASSCGGDVQLFWRGDTLPPPPWTQRKVHSPVLRHGGDTAKSVCSPSRGRVPDSSPWILFHLFFTTTVQFTEQPSVHPPLIQVLKNSVSPLMLYLLHSSKNPVSLLMTYPSSYCIFCQGKPGQGLQ